MRGLIKPLLLLIYTLCVTVEVAADTSGDNSRWVDRKAEGWFWYKADPIIEEQEEEPKKPPEPVTVIAAPTPQEPQGPAPLSAAWIRENIQAYMDAAIDNPTRENISAYLYIQRYAMDKSTAFADATQEVTLGHAVFDEISRRPLAAHAKRAIDQRATERNDQVLRKISEVAGLFFFMDSSESTRVQVPQVDALARNFNFSVIKVAADNHPQLLAQEGIRRDSGHREQMGINTLPSLVLIRADGVYDIVSQAAITYGAMQKRLLLGAKRLGIISEAEYNSTRPLTNVENTLVSRVPNSEATQAAALPIPSREIINRFTGVPTYE
ncbi:MAG: conjugal transfer protein TraF [Cellvibrionaceae bacterium]|nr:conjugal transfer protein TraF [Cellvibrionaceae bacterium]